MNNETDLDWLARHVHVWPDGKREALVCYPRNVDTLIWSCVLSNTGWITKEQWLARRAELQNKPSWKDAPDWAGWLAQDEDGVWYWHQNEPGQNGEDVNNCRYWLSHGESDIADGGGELLGDWHDTLEKRPEQKAFDPFSSVEDAAAAKHATITPSKYTKTIHGVSVDVYDVLQAWGVSNPALQHLIKKALQCGQRGHKDNAQDLQDIIDSAIRAKELG